MRLLIACGGTGGHIFPGLSLYRALKNRQPDSEIVLVLDKRAISQSIIDDKFKYIFISFTPLRFKFDLQGIFIVLKLSKGIFECLKILISFRPNVVIGFGGYASFLLAFIASVLRIKTVIHEQNITPGRANSVLAYFVDKIAVSFDETRCRFGTNSHKVKLTGNPLRPNLSRIEKKDAYKFLGLYPDRFTILVVGGSQGAHKINITFFEAINLIKEKSKFQIIHLCGDKDYPFLNGAYKKLNIEAKVFSFLKSMEYVYSVADIVVSRGGAATINELSFYGLPSIIIPYPYVRGHQVENAGYLLQNNAAILIEEDNLYPEVLNDNILDLFNNADLRGSIGKNILMLSRPEADESLANLVLNG